MKKLLFTLSIITITFTSFSTIHEIGLGKTHATPNSLYLANNSTKILFNGDTIDIYSGTYNTTSTYAKWDADNLHFRGKGVKPVLNANGGSFLGKGIWVINGDSNIVENIEFKNAACSSKNGAGIRLQGIGLTVKNCYFHDNENGILTGNNYAGDILIEYSEFNHNGNGDGYSHNIYVGHVNKLTVRYSYFHHAKVGHNLKSRAKENYILYNRIMDEGTGNSSHIIDIPNGGYALVMGNLLMQGPVATSNKLMAYGQEGLKTTSAPHNLYFVHNTCVNKRTASCNFVKIKAGTTIANVSNNIFAGTGTVINGTTTTYSNNYINTSISSLNFVNESNYDYHLTTSSPAKDYGTNLVSNLTPNLSYNHPLNHELRTMIGGIIDAGCYEFGLSLPGIKELNTFTFKAFPNPVKNELFLSKNTINSSYKIISIEGKMIQEGKVTSQSINTSFIKKGVYFITINKEEKIGVLKFVK